MRPRSPRHPVLEGHVDRFPKAKAQWEASDRSSIDSLVNWSLRYPDSVTARLSPAYDLVATIIYVPEAEVPRDYDTLALNLARSKLFADVSLGSFERMGRKLGVSPALVASTAKEAAERIQDAWRTVRGDLSLDTAAKDMIERHWRRVPLAHGA